MKRISMTTQNGMQVVGESFGPETIIKDLSELIANIEIYDTPQDIREKIKQANIDFNIIFESEQDRNLFIQSLKGTLSNWSKSTSIYFGMKDSLVDKSHSMNHLGSRELCSQINEILKGQTTDFANAIRETEIQIARDELEASKSDEIKAYIGDSKERKLENEINQFLLNHDIAMTRIEIQKSKKMQQLAQLGRQARSGQITAAEWGKQRRIIELEIDSMNLEQEARTHFTNYQTGVRRHQLGEGIDKREIFESDHIYRTTNFEKNRIDIEIAFQSGNCTRAEYEERIQEIEKEIEQENRRFDNQMRLNFPQQETKNISEGNDINKINQRVIDEAILVHTAFNDEIAAMNDNMYSRYHQQNADWYRSFSSRFNQILGFQGQSIDELTSCISTINLTSEQKRALTQLRKEPMFKKLMGETALQQKAELETILGTRISPDGMTFADENGPRIAIKTEQQLEEELSLSSDKLSELLSSGAISEEKYDNYIQNLDYIYDYYISRSKGEQIPFRKITNAQYEAIEQRAKENGISFNEQLLNETTVLMEDHEEIQESQRQGMRR